ncbi:hypothetical protein GCM10023319_24180 [Nocardia iowensis]
MLRVGCRTLSVEDGSPLLRRQHLQHVVGQERRRIGLGLADNLGLGLGSRLALRLEHGRSLLRRQHFQDVLGQERGRIRFGAFGRARAGFGGLFLDREPDGLAELAGLVHDDTGVIGELIAESGAAPGLRLHTRLAFPRKLRAVIGNPDSDRPMRGLPAHDRLEQPVGAGVPRHVADQLGSQQHRVVDLVRIGPVAHQIPDRLPRFGARGRLPLDDRDRGPTHRLLARNRIRSPGGIGRIGILLARCLVRRGADTKLIVRRPDVAVADALDDLTVLPDDGPGLRGLVAGAPGQFGQRQHAAVIGAEPFPALLVGAEVDHFLGIDQESRCTRGVFAQILHRVAVCADIVPVAGGSALEHPGRRTASVLAKAHLLHSVDQVSLRGGRRVGVESLQLRPIQVRAGLAPGRSGRVARPDPRQRRHRALLIDEPSDRFRHTVVRNEMGFQLSDVLGGPQHLGTQLGVYLGQLGRVAQPHLGELASGEVAVDLGDVFRLHPGQVDTGEPQPIPQGRRDFR